MLSYFLYYSPSSPKSALVLVDAGMPVITTFTIGNKNKSLLATRAKCVCYTEKINNSASDGLGATIGHKTGKVHCGILNKVYSFSHQIILSSYCVPVRDDIILSIKQHYYGTTTTSFVFLIE